MQENCAKDPAIKLFGKKIPLTADGVSPPISGHELPPLERAEEDKEKAEMKDFPAEVRESRQEDDAPIQVTEECEDPEISAETSVNPKTPSINEGSAKSKTLRTEKEENDAANSQGKTLKKPDKILPCPRCNSMETKFCYYNNYNINQPRHFCKACQRYWTAGGTMRNVPVGAGRRKNKSSASHYRHITISEALQAARMESPTGTHSPALKTNGRVLSFGLDQSMCDSVASVLSLANKKAMKNGYHIEETRIPVACKGRENGGGDACSSGSSVTVSNSTEEGGRTCSQESYMQSVNGFGSPIPCLPGVPWPYPWSSTLPPPPPAFCPPGFPISFYPPIWNCGIAAAGGWNIPLLSPQSSSNQKTILGKHSRNGETVKPYETEKEPENHKNGCVLVPKILRIDDPTEAAKSSIWATLGIKNESLTGEKLFKAFHPKSEEKNHVVETSAVLMANPAALSRSINFHERS